jgi:DNA topoisomerase-1
MLEKKGIGRPSTFSSLISKIQDREYVKKGNVEGKPVACVDYQLVKEELDEIEITRTFGNEKGKLLIQPLGIMVIEFLLKQFDSLFVYEYTEKMEKELDSISQGNLNWQELCKKCDATMSSLMTEIKDNKSHIKIDDHHVYMIGKYGPVIKYEKDGTTEFKNVKKDLDLDKLKNGEYKLENIIVEKPKFGGKNLGSFKSNEVILRKGKFGLYMTCGGKNYSLKGIDKSLEGIRLEDVIDILLGTKSTNPKVLKMLNEDMSVRKGKYGPYLFYKKKTMTKPRFFGIYEVFGGNKGDTFDWKSKSSSELINLVKKNCLKSV